MGKVILLFHIVTASIGLISGLLSMALRKGSGLHSAAGSVFTISMVCMGTSGALYSLAIDYKPLTVLVGLLVTYLVLTSWRAAKRREMAIDLFDRAGLAFILAVSLYGIGHGFKGDRFATVYFVMGSIALGCAIADVRFVRRGGVAGTARLVRHLWRNSVALLIALLSFYPGNAKLFPRVWRDTNLLTVPHLLVLAAMLFWLARMSRRNRKPKEGISNERVHFEFAAARNPLFHSPAAGRVRHE